MVLNNTKQSRLIVIRMGMPFNGKAEKNQLIRCAKN